MFYHLQMVRTLIHATWDDGDIHQRLQLLKRLWLYIMAIMLLKFREVMLKLSNLTDTSNAIREIISQSKENNEKAICFVTGVPGAGKTLVGLDIATKHLDKRK